MKTVAILGAFIAFELLVNAVECSNWLDELTEYIAEDSGARQVALLTNLGGNETTRSPLIDDISMKLLAKIPVRKIDTPKDFKPSKGAPNTDTTATLFLLVHESSDAPASLPSRSFLQAVAAMAVLHYKPKYLVLSIGAVASESLKGFLEYAWSLRLLDLTIIEWVDSKGAQTMKSAGYQMNLPTIHRLNPFKNEYTKLRWTGNDVPLFPDKVSDMWGHRLRVRVVDSEPFTIGKFNERGEPIRIAGANIVLLQTVARAMNATLKYLQPTYEVDRSKFESEHDYVHYNGVLQRFDVSSYLLVASATSPYRSLRTSPILYDDFCAVVPVQKISTGPDFKDLIKAFSLSIVTVLIFSTVSRTLRFSPRIWGVFYIMRLFFGVSVTRQPRRNVERIIFATLLAISAIDSSSIYTAMTDVSIHTFETKEFHTVKELADSELKPIIGPFSCNKTFFGAQGPLLKLKKKIAVFKKPFTVMHCAKRAARDKNITCLMDTARAAIAVARSRRGKEDKIKISKVCFWSDNYAFQLNGRLPYRFKIDERIGAMKSAGLINRLYRVEKDEDDGTPKNIEEEIADENEKNKTELHRHLLTVIAVGYSASLFVFVIEIVVHRVSKYRKSKIQPAYFPFTE